MTAAAALLQEIHNDLQMCGISKRVARTWLIDNKRFKSLEDFGVINGDMYIMDMEKRLESRAIATCVNLSTVQIKWHQSLFWWIHDHQTHNQPLIAAEFVQVFKREVMSGKLIEKER